MRGVRGVRGVREGGMADDATGDGAALAQRERQARALESAEASLALGLESAPGPASTVGHDTSHATGHPSALPEPRAVALRLLAHARGVLELEVRARRVGVALATGW